MLDIFADLKQSQNTTSHSKNLAVIVEGYDISAKNKDQHFVYGKDFNTGEDVKVFLEQSRIEKALGGSKFAPPSIEIFKQGDLNSNKLDNRIVKEGGIILFSNVYEKDGMYSASWATAVIHNNAEEDKKSKYSERSILIYGLTNISFGLKKSDGKAYFAATTLLADADYYKYLSDLAKPHFEYKKGTPITAKAFSELANLKKYCAILFDKKYLGFVLRANAESGVAGTFNVEPPAFRETEMSGKDLVQERLAAPLANIEAALEAGQLVNVEVIPYIRVWGGSFTQETVAKELGANAKTWLRRLRPMYQETDGQGNFFIQQKENRLWTKSFMKVLIMGDKFGNVTNEDGSFKGITFGGVVSPQGGENSYRGLENAALFVNTEYAPNAEQEMLAKANTSETKLFYKRDEIYELLGFVKKDNGAMSQAAPQSTPDAPSYTQNAPAEEYNQEQTPNYPPMPESNDDWDDDIPF